MVNVGKRLVSDGLEKLPFLWVNILETFPFHRHGWRKYLKVEADQSSWLCNDLTHENCHETSSQCCCVDRRISASRRVDSCAAQGQKGISLHENLFFQANVVHPTSYHHWRVIPSRVQCFAVYHIYVPSSCWYHCCMSFWMVLTWHRPP